MHIIRFSAILLGAAFCLPLAAMTCCQSTQEVHGGAKSPEEQTQPGNLSCMPAVHVRALPIMPNEIFSANVNYPGSVPEYNAANYPWLQYDPTNASQWRAYLCAVLKYAYAGNIEFDWRSERSGSRWYHAPWMHRRYRWDSAGGHLKDSTGFGGREWVHGLTQERPGKLLELDRALTGDSTPTTTWAVSMYNEAGGYTIGRVWQNMCEGRIADTLLFQPGTVAIKLLFTTADTEKVRYLRGGVNWKANIDSLNPDATPTLHLLQIDIAVRDTRAEGATGWVFGTFVMRADLPINTLFGDTSRIAGSLRPWYHMQPLGLAWGNDPATALARPPLPARCEQYIDIELSRRIRDTLGWMGRLNGPADNRNASCVGCHGLAQRPVLEHTLFNSASNAFLTNNQETLAGYFQANLKPYRAHDTGMVSLDYSLQLQTGIANYWNYRRHMRTIGAGNHAGDRARRLKSDTSLPLYPAFNAVER